MTVNLYDVEDRELVLCFYNSVVIDICTGVEKWGKGRVLDILRQVSDGVPFDSLDLSGLTRSEGMTTKDLQAEMDWLDDTWGVVATAYPETIKIDLTSAGFLSRYVLGYDC